jgi:hypothetical protein
MGRRPQAEPGLASHTECHTVKNVGEPCAGECVEEGVWLADESSARVIA